MAESIVQVTEGSGKKLHTFQRTIGANNVEDEVVIVGEQYLAAYQVVVVGVSATTANSHMLQIMAGASLKVYLRRLTIYQATGLAGAATIVDTQIIRLTTAGTGGTVITAQPNDTTDAAAGATAMALPTVKGAEGVVLKRFGYGALAAAPTSSQGTLLFDWAPTSKSKSIVIPAGAANGICVKNITALATATYHIIAEIDEANF